MIKRDIINKVSKKTGIDREDTHLLFESFVQTIKESMIEGDNALYYTHLTLPTKA